MHIYFKILSSSRHWAYMQFIVSHCITSSPKTRYKPVVPVMDMRQSLTLPAACEVLTVKNARCWTCAADNPGPVAETELASTTSTV